MKKIKIFLMTIFALTFISCTNAEIDEFIRIVNDTNSYINYSQNEYNGAVERQSIRHNLQYIIQEDYYGYVNSLEVIGSVENLKNYPVKVVITAPIVNESGRTLQNLVFTKTIQQKSIKEFKEIKRIPRSILGKIYKRDITINVFRSTQYENEKYNYNNYNNYYSSSNSYRYSDLNFRVNTDYYNTAKEVIVRGNLVNKSNYREKNVIEVPIKDNYGRVINFMKLEKTLSPNSRIYVNEVISIPSRLKGYVNPRDIKVTKTKLESVWNREKINKSDVKLTEIKSEVSRDRYGYVSYINFEGRLSNTSYFPASVIITIPLLDDFGNVIHEFTSIEKINSYETKNLSKIIRVPARVRGYTNESLIDITVRN